MPLAASFTSGVLSELLRQLEYAPNETHQRQMIAAEELLEDIEETRLYPEDFITYRITGYRSDRPGARTSVVGEALRRDLVTFIQSLSWDLDLPLQMPRGMAVEMDEVARRLGVSRRTLQRCRREGLVLHYVRLADGHRRLACYPDSLERFLAHSSGRVSRASSFSRLDPGDREAIIERARVIAFEDGTSLNEAARRIAIEHGRGHETIRGILRANDRDSGSPIFQEHGPLTERDVRLIERARRRGIPLAEVGDRLGKSVAALHRAMLRERRRRLRSLPLLWGGNEGDEHLLDAPSLHVDLPHHAIFHETSLLEGSRAVDVDSPGIMLDLKAKSMLVANAASAIAKLPRTPNVAELDIIETRLRHASMLQLRVMLACLPATVDVIESQAHQPLGGLPPGERRSFLQLAVDVLLETIEGVDVHAEVDLSDHCAIAMQAELDRRDTPFKSGRASARYRPAILGLDRMFYEEIPWTWLVPTSSILRRIDEADSRNADLARRRYGLMGNSPRTLQQLADEEGATPATIERWIGSFW